jgi:hypothetical protein
MTSKTAHRRRGLGALFVPLIIALGALPLMAPTCGSSGEGFKVFSRRSLIIPMDVCYQYSTDLSGATFTPAGGATECPSVDSGDVVKAYGLVYQLIRNGIAVYWVINNQKTAVTDVDLTVQYDGGIPVYLFDWGTGLEGAPPVIGNGGHLINYRGGPFVVDGSDFTRASTVLQSFRTTFGNVNVHVSNVAFRGYSKRTMAGGWNAGGAVPPKLALLDIGSSGSGSKNSEVVIQGYLTRAGLDTPGAMGYANPAQGVHGEIFDRLFLPDFLGTDWRTSRLYQNDYQILWVPHWTAPSSCSDCPPSTSCTCQLKYPAAQIAQTLKNIGSFVYDTSGGRVPGDMFAECAGLGSFEGVFSSTDPSNLNYSGTYVLAPTSSGGEPTTHFETQADAGSGAKTGVWINKAVTSPLYRGSFSSPLMQIGDFRFIPRDGAIQNFKPNLYKTEVVRLISDATNPAYDVFTHVPGTSSHGTIVYLGGHSYSGTDPASSFQIAGSRLVLNTLFNLGSACTATGVACQTGLPGLCSTGKYACQAGAPDPVCIPDRQPGQFPEICNGLDDDCDGQVDENLQTNCYEKPAGYVDPLNRTFDAFMATSTVGVCRTGISVCQQNPDGSYAMSACTGQVLPVAETCNGLDDDCNGVVDDPSALPTIACYDGPPATQNIGICRPGEQFCVQGQWGALKGGVFTQGYCGGEVLPKAENCNDSGSPGGAQDDDCNGVVNNGCTCAPGATQACFSGPGTANVGTCVPGVQTCQTGGYWGPCVGQVVGTTTEACVPGAVYDAGPVPASYDTNCDGKTSRCADCSAGQVDPDGCWTAQLPALPPGSHWGVGQCVRGARTCTTGGTWGACTGYVLPSSDLEGPIEYCDGKDNNCNGLVDENALCPVGNACLRGVCVQATCGTERPPPEGYTCSTGFDPSGAHSVVSSSCGDLPPPGCAVGQLCEYGNCVDPCPVTTSVVGGTLVTSSAVCAQGTVCGGGACIAGGCYEAGCQPTATGQTQLCLGGACVPDPCDGKSCPSGTFCRQGDCVQACTFVTCFTGEKCGIDGFCEQDLCAGKLCSAGQKCAAGVCAADPCTGKGCAAGQICQTQGTTAVCVDDPCTGVVCPAGICASGQCYPVGNPTGAGTASRTTPKSSGGCGCGSGTGVALPGLLALLALPLARRRRRSLPAGGPRGRGALLLLLVSVALVGTACKEKKSAAQFDPSTCTATCPGEQRCIDISTDPSHCGATVATACNHACNAAEQCVDGVCGPTSLVAPFVRSLSPATGVKDNPAVVVAFAGDRFQQGADVRMSVGGTTRSASCGAAACTTTPCCQWLSTSSLSLHLDLTDASPGAPWTMRVVNTDGVISNAKAFGVVIPTPVLTSVTPSTVLSGAGTTLVVSGSGFTGGSRCQLSGVTGVGTLALPTALRAGATQLECTLDATALPPGVYTLAVVSEQDASGVTHTSNGLPVTVSPSDPVVYSVDPGNVDPQGSATVASFLVTGLRFDVKTAQVLFYVPPALEAALSPANVTTISSGAILVHDLHVGPGQPYPPAAYTVAVRNGTPGSYRTSNGVQFVVGAASTRAVNSFSPSLANQGQVVTLTFNGTDFPAGSQIEIQPPGSTTFTALTTTVTGGTSASATMSFVGQPEGQWSVRLRFGATASDPTSAPWPLRILSNQAILRDYTTSPGDAQAGTVGSTKTSLTFSVANILSPNVKVFLVDPSGLTTVRTLNATNGVGATTLTITGAPALDLTGLDTGTYTFRVANANAAPSNGLPFAVNAGAPTLTGVCLAGTSCTRYGVQGASVTIRLTGTNFATPDSSGNGSVVMAAADFVSNWATPDPCNVVTTSGTQFQQVPGTATVVSPTQLDVQVDTLSAYVDPSWGTTYYVGVWNPGGVSGLQKSSCGVDPRTLPWFRLCAKATGTTCTQ